MSLIFRLTLLLLAVLHAPGALAACTVAPVTTLSFAPASSYDVRNSAVAAISGVAGFSCNGSIISVISSNHARATASSSNGFMLRSGSAAIPYRLSADNAGSYGFNSGATIDYFDPSLLAVLGILNGGTFVPPIYAAVTAGPNVPAGTYTDTVTIQWNWTVCHGIGVGGVCILQESGTATATVTISLVVAKDCRISAPSLSFGSAPLVTGFNPVTQAVAVDCTLNTAYAVAFSAGANGSARPWRAMADSAGHKLQYNIYRSDGTTIWDESAPLSSPVAGFGALVPAQLQTYVARINPAQTTPPAGRYTDTVSVIVTF